MQIFLNDRIVPEHEAMVSVFDHGFLYGDGIYETMRAYDGTVFMLERHIERLNRSASLIQLIVPSPDIIRDAVYETIRSNGLKSAYVRVTVSRGKGPIGLDPALCPKPTVVVIAEEFREYPEKYYSEGVRFIMAKTRRNLKEALNPKIKSLNFLNNILAKIEAKEQGAYEALMLNAEGFISEGTVCNIFFVKDSILCTPSVDTGVLDGITRELVIGLAKETGMLVKEGNFLPEDLFSASEVFFTNTTSEVMPVSQVEDMKYAVGDVTRRLRKLYGDEVRKFLLMNKG
ncbi:MAG: branched-chain-amino-acid transaminase [Nitrospirota bacterium]|nr:branched-chain-amino-acid transaminase [Nitrospirota bacterium]